jgi:thiosulfate/3-mercaptopyruvate sulfurtransferase
MIYTTLIETDQLAAHLGDPDWAIIDCRFALADPTLGRSQYLAGHIPGAIYADLDSDLSGPIVPGQTGRHPLPDEAEFVATVGRWGVDAGVQVVVYDSAGGMVAGRVWWMLRRLGHLRVAVLNGDWRAWQREGRPTHAGEERRPGRLFVPARRPNQTADADEVLARLGDPTLTLLDARARDRFRGENETLDAKGGHIPGAKPAPYTENLDAQGYFLRTDALAARWRELLGTTPSEEVILYCGSGVSAAHNALALVHAGFAQPRLYPGSWSEWITDPARPVATGDEHV